MKKVSIQTRIKMSKNNARYWKGKTHSQKTKDQISQNRKGKNTIEQEKNKNPNWKGDKVSYSGLHRWIRKNFIKIDKCENKKCPHKNPKRIDWANKGIYNRDRKNWMRLCRSCHIWYDKLKK